MRRAPRHDVWRRLTAIQQRQLDVLERRCAGQQIEPLEHEPEKVAPEQRALIAREGFDVHAAEHVRTRRRHIQAAQDVHHRRFAGAAGSHDGNELAFVDTQVHAP